MTSGVLGVTILVRDPFYRDRAVQARIVAALTLVLKACAPSFDWLLDQVVLDPVQPTSTEKILSLIYDLLAKPAFQAQDFVWRRNLLIQHFAMCRDRAIALRDWSRRIEGDGRRDLNAVRGPFLVLSSSEDVLAGLTMPYACLQSRCQTAEVRFDLARGLFLEDHAAMKTAPHAPSMRIVIILNQLDAMRNFGQMAVISTLGSLDDEASGIKVFL